MSVLPSELRDRVKAIRVALDELRDADTSALTGRELLEHHHQLGVLRNAFDAMAVTSVADLDSSSAWALDAAVTVKSWLKSKTRVLGRDAHRMVKVAKGLTQMRHATDSFVEGRITIDHCVALTRCLQARVRDAFTDEVEARLVVEAEVMTADEFAQHIAAWVDRHDADGPEPPREGDRDELHASETMDGRTMGTFNLGPDTGRLFREAIERRAKQLFLEDQKLTDVDWTDPSVHRSMANRRAQALYELVMAGVAADAAGKGGHIGPAFLIMINAALVASFRGHDDSCPDECDERHPVDAEGEPLHELPDGTFIPRRIVEKWLCDAPVARAVLGATGELLALGRMSRTVSRAQRRALIARDRGCAVPGCDRPPRWCHAHHIRWWKRDDGPTDIDNLVLVCSHHHHRIHEGRLTVRMVEGVPRFWNQHHEELHRRPAAVGA